MPQLGGTRAQGGRLGKYWSPARAAIPLRARTGATLADLKDWKGFFWTVGSALAKPTMADGVGIWSGGPLGRAEACGGDHPFDLDGRQPLAAHGLRGAEGGQAREAGSTGVLGAVVHAKSLGPSYHLGVHGVSNTHPVEACRRRRPKARFSNTSRCVKNEPKLAPVHSKPHAAPIQVGVAEGIRH